MKILIVNKFLYPRGGDCIHALSVGRLLAEAGHKVRYYAMSYPDNLPCADEAYFAPAVSFSGGLGALLRAAGRTLFGQGTDKSFIRLLHDFRPDVVHLHNIHSYLSPHLAQLARQQDIRVVWTLHDYKLLCPTYNFLRKSQPCEACLTGKWPVVRHRCMKQSLPASLLAYLEANRWSRPHLQGLTDAFVCPSHFMKQKMEQGGFTASKLHVVHNFTTAPATPPQPREARNYCLYVGRLSPEKGVDTLLNAATRLPHLPLLIAGTGPQEEALHQRFGQHAHIRFLGQCTPQKVDELMAGARMLVIPSVWYENNPLSLIEALAHGTPVVGSRMGGIPELLTGANGLLVQPGNADDLQLAIAQAWDTSFNYSRIAGEALQHFSGQRYLDEIRKIYKP